jgi:excisionase family DNA binding protein
MPDHLPLSDPDPSQAVSLSDRLTWSLSELSSLTGISVRQLRRLDADRNIPGRLTCGRKVLFTAEAVREWLRAGCPDRQRWEALQRAAQHNSRPR